ncbi:UNVERIFIED_CONTAM: hypothetical protein Sangu_2323100 [Sesamum angustifolium]|uniref:Uncharacterized protein n=1 Tax=Sesamum angustifolium TaxID=2727405 RepID=A0AAW2L860_9LAMI
MGRGVKLSNTQTLKTDEEIEKVREITYALAIGNMQYVGHCTKPDIALDLSVTSIYQACADKAQWCAVKTILKYLRSKEMFL